MFEHGYKMGKKYLGEDHYFTQRFVRRMAKPLGSGQSKHPSPHKSIKHESTKMSQGRLAEGNESSEVIVDVVTNPGS